MILIIKHRQKYKKDINPSQLVINYQLVTK